MCDSFEFVWSRCIYGWEMVLHSVLGDWGLTNKVGFIEEETDGCMPFLFFSFCGSLLPRRNASTQTFWCFSLEAFLLWSKRPSIWYFFFFFTLSIFCFWFYICAHVTLFVYLVSFFHIKHSYFEMNLGFGLLIYNFCGLFVLSFKLLIHTLWLLKKRKRECGIFEWPFLIHLLFDGFWDFRCFSFTMVGVTKITFLGFLGFWIWNFWFSPPVENFDMIIF